MAAIAAALDHKNDLQACRAFCTEALGSSLRWGPVEQQALLERLPVLCCRLHAWLALTDKGAEEALLRVFHPQSRLSSCLSALGAPGFLLQLRLLPPRVVRAVLLASGGPRDRTAFQAAGLGGGSAWLSQLGAGRLARSATGDVEGLTLTAQELLLTCLVHFAQGKPPAAKPAVSIGGGGSSSGSSAQPNRAGDGTQGTDGVGGGASTGMSTIMMGSSTSGSGRAPRAPGSLSPAFERLLLAHLKAYLKHDTYELAYAHEPQATRFLLHLLHEFLIAPEPVEQVLPAGYAGSVGLQPGQPDPESIRWRAQPMPLYAARLVALHVLANPALRHECEEVGSPGATALGSHASRFTREVSLLGQPLIDFVTDLLRASQSRKQFSLEAMTSLTRLWLVLLQPWKAKRLLGWYHSVRSPEPKLEPPAPLAPAGTAARARGQVDVALLGLEPETASGGAEAPPPPLPEGYAAAPARRDRAGAGAAPTADSVVVVPGDGDARSWRSYVVSFHGAYCLLEAFLAAPLHMDLCLALARHRAATAAPASAAAAAQSLAAQSLAAVQAPLGAGPGDAARGAQLLRQKHVVAALKALGQALLCFTDPQLCRVLEELRGGAAGGQARLAVPLFSDGGVLNARSVQAVALAWAALLDAAAVPELQPLLAGISRQLQQSPKWSGARRFPAPEEPAAAHRQFAREVLGELDAPAAAASPPLGGAAAPALVVATPLLQAQFVGSEWQRPPRGGEVEAMLHVAYWVAVVIDRLLGRELRLVTSGHVPQTEWPRMFANWRFSGFVAVLLCVILLS